MGKYIKLLTVERMDKKGQDLVWMDCDYYSQVGNYVEYNNTIGKVNEEMEIFLSNMEDPKELNLIVKLSGQKKIYKAKALFYRTEYNPTIEHEDLNNYANIMEGIE